MLQHYTKTITEYSEGANLTTVAVFLFLFFYFVK